MKMTVKEFIELWADGTHDDIDVTENVSECFCIAYCGNQLTKAGEKEWADVLNYSIEVYEDPRWPEAVVDVTTAPNNRVDRVRLFFYSLAGYCTENCYNKWFREV